jgi:putative SOS response-associated peptidase YedK
VCGRYATSRTAQQLEDDFLASIPPGYVHPQLSFNMAPTMTAPIVVRRADGGRELRAARWGLVPSWAKDPAIGTRLINARSETVASKPAFRSAFAHRRAIVPADGYYEWYVPTVGPKTPYFISRPSKLALAGLWETWSGPADDSLLTTFTILTTAATGEGPQIHDRAPLLVEPDVADSWLRGDSDALGRLEAATAGRLDAWPVSRAVNSVRNDGPELTEPIGLEPDPHVGPGAE